MKRKLLGFGTVALAALAIGATGCGEDDEKATSSTGGSEMGSTDTRAGSATETGASELRATLTAGLQEHVYLAGIAISNGVGAGLDSAEFKAAAGTLDKNSIALSEAIGSVYGDAAGEQFLALWRDHITFFVEYTEAKATGDAKGAQAAKKKLDGYRAEFGAFLASANPNLTQKAVADELKPHVSTVFATIDAVVAKSPKTFDLLQEAASHMPTTANVLAGAIANQFPDKFGSYPARWGPPPGAVARRRPPRPLPRQETST
jgi:hypothetical protein